MGIPEGSFAVAALIVFAFPGFVYGAVRRWARGERAGDRDTALSIARGAIFSVVLTSVYLVLAGGALFSGLTAGPKEETLALADARAVGGVVLVLYILVPLVIALLLHRKDIHWRETDADGRRRLRWPRSVHGYEGTPTAWDHAVLRNVHSLVKIRRADGIWVGGWYSGGSFASTYPEPPSLYLDRQFAMTEDGNFTGEVTGTGVYLRIADDDVVMWTRKYSAAP